MKRQVLRQHLQALLSQAGIQINGSQPWDIQIHNDKFYDIALAKGSLGIGEAYVAGWWDCVRLDEFFSKILRAGIDQTIGKDLKSLLQGIYSKVLNLQSAGRAIVNGQRHYDLGMDLFEQMLDKSMTYTCAFWEEGDDLDAAQVHKLDLTCRKLGLKPGMSVLDIGCGWGSFARYAAEHYGVEVTGVTVSKDQTAYAARQCADLPVTIRLLDYRAVRGEFDRVVSLGMFEHVGQKNYRRFMRVVSRVLREDGLFLLHTIGSNKSETSNDPWISRYVFPGSLLPSIRQIARSVEGLFVMEDWHNLSNHYDQTLMAWHENFQQHWSTLKAHYDEHFFRLWQYYLLMCAGSFRSRKNQLWQIVFSKHGIPGGYISLR